VPKPAHDKIIKEAYDETVKEAYDEVIPGHWWNWSPNHNQGPFTGPPSFPTDSRGTWQGPHTNGGPAGTGTYQAGGGHGSWFHREASTTVHHDAVIVHHDAVIKHYPAVVCPPDNPTPVQFSGFSAPTPPTCDEPGSFSQQPFEGITFDVSPDFDGPGTYTVTATLVDDENTTFPDGTTAPKSTQITVDAATGVTQSSNPEAPCYQAAPPPPNEPPVTPKPNPAPKPQPAPQQPAAKKPAPAPAPETPETQETSAPTLPNTGA